MILERLRQFHPGWAYSLWKSNGDAMFTRQMSTTSALSRAIEAPPSPPFRRVVVTGIGLVTPLGTGVQRVWERLIAGDTAIRALTEEDLPQDHRSAFSSLPSKVIGCIDRGQLSNAPWYPANQDLRREAPFVTFATAAAAEALQDAQWAPHSEQDRQATGVAIGAGMSCTTDMAEAGALLKDGKLRRLSPFFVPRTLVNMAAGAVSMAFGLQGPNHAVSTACASGAHGIGDAFRMVQRGDASVMVAGGTEACVDAVALAGFSRLKALSTKYNDDPQRASRPFDKDRDGFVLGEGAGMLILEELEHARARNAHIYAEIRGYGMSSDAYHITQPPPDGAGAALAMRRALAVAGIAPSQIAYINAHATSTPIGDDVEQNAIASVFLNDKERNQYCPIVSSTKGAVGHLLGAAGAVEAAFTVLASYHRLAPPNCNLEVPDLELLPGLVVGKEAVELKDAERRPAVLSNSFGFGGTNASLVFGPRPSS
jgi:3-oxoacyl-[acyl-carrier-protein] synthase II